MAKKSKSENTLVTFLLDRTGSMEAIKKDTIGAFNAYLNGLKEGGDKIDFTFVQFDSMGIDKVYVREPIAKVELLNDATYQPRAWTPLIDASYKTIKAVEESLAGDKKTKVVVCIQTDGDENASKQYSWEQLNELIKEKIKLGWQFNFMGAGIDAYKQGARMGIQTSNTMSYNAADPVATMSAFRASATNTSNFASGAKADMAYSALQKSASGDKFDPAAQGPKSSTPTVDPDWAKKLKAKIEDNIVEDFKL